MSDRNTSSIKDRLLQLVAEILAKRSIADPISKDDELTQLGLTSLDMVELMLKIEAEFDITIPASEITPANFRTIASVERMIAGILGRIARP